MLGVVAATSILGNRLIIERFPDRPRPRDLLFELLPYVEWTRYLTVVALVIGFAIFLYYAVRLEPERIPAFTTVFAIMYILRAAIMILTPLASSEGDKPFVFTLQQYGMFPSGHIAASLILVLLTSAALAPGLRKVQWGLFVMEGVGLVLAHGHYSIDLVGGLLLAFFVVQTWQHGRLFGPLKRLTGA
jgi:membrane-associated phospholipid phosphatase